MTKISRSLLIYWLAIGLLGGGLFWTYKVWNNKGRAETKMKAILAANEKLPWRYYLAVYGPKAVLINSGLCIFLLAAGPWGVRKLQAKAAAGPEEPGKRTTIIVVALTMLASGVWASKRMNYSLWTDEATSMLKFSVGEYEQADGKWQFDPVSPDYRQFSMMTPNNHMLYSTISGLTHQALVTEAKGPEEMYFSEWALRLPAFIAGLAALASIAWLAGELGLRRVGWVAAVLLALHPWHLHYTSEARGYSMMMALIPAFLAAAIRAVRTGQWRWWMLLTILQVAMIDTWPLAVDFVVLANLAIFGMLLTSAWRGADRFTQLGRWAIVSIFGAMGALQLLLPAFPQISLYLKVQALFTFDVYRYVIDPLWSLFTGAAWTLFDRNNPYVFGWSAAFEQHPVLVVLFVLFLATLFVAGCRQLWRHSIPARWILVLSVVLPVAIALHLLQRKFIYLPWYGVPSLTGVILILAAGFIALFGKSRWVWKVCAPACAAVMITALWPQHWAMRTVPHGCNREAALLTRHILNPEHPEFGKDAITAYLAAFYKTYDVQAQRLEKLEDLEKLMTQSRAEQRPLFVNLAREGLVYGPGQEILKALRDPQQFETLPPLYGTDPEATHWIFKYLGK